MTQETKQESGREVPAAGMLEHLPSSGHAGGQQLPLPQPLPGTFPTLISGSRCQAVR